MAKERTRERQKAKEIGARAGKDIGVRAENDGAAKDGKEMEAKEESLEILKDKVSGHEREEERTA